MNITYGLAILASVQKELGWNLPFPGEIAAWDFEKNLSSAKLIAYHAESAVLSDMVADQVLNIAGGSMFACGKFWPVLAKQYGIEYGVSEVNELKFQTIQVPLAPPPRGFGPAGKVKIGWSFEEWAEKPEVVTAWKTIKERHGITELKDPFSGRNVKDVFGLLDGELLGGWLWSVRYVNVNSLENGC